MIYGFVRQSGGQVRIYLEVGKGAIVCLHLPRHHGKTEAVQELARLLAEMPQGVAGQSVLVVATSLRSECSWEVLSELGYSPIDAPDGATALKV